MRFRRSRLELRNDPGTISPFESEEMRAYLNKDVKLAPDISFPSDVKLAPDVKIGKFKPFLLNAIGIDGKGTIITVMIPEGITQSNHTLMMLDAEISHYIRSGLNAGKTPNQVKGIIQLHRSNWWNGRRPLVERILKREVEAKKKDNSQVIQHGLSLENLIAPPKKGVNPIQKDDVVVEEEDVEEEDVEEEDDVVVIVEEDVEEEDVEEAISPDEEEDDDVVVIVEEDEDPEEVKKEVIKRIKQNRMVQNRMVPSMVPSLPFYKHPNFVPIASGVTVALILGYILLVKGK